MTFLDFRVDVVKIYKVKIIMDVCRGCGKQVGNNLVK